MTVQIPSSLPLSREIALPPGSQVITLPSSGHYSLSFRQSENGTQLVVVPVDRDTETAPPMTVGAATEVPHMKRFLRQKLLEKKAREQLAKKEQRMRLKEARSSTTPTTTKTGTRGCQVTTKENEGTTISLSSHYDPRRIRA